MMNKVFAAGTAIMAVASAIPTDSPPKKWYSLDQVARFDNIDGIPAVAISPIDIYNNLFWQGMSLVQTIPQNIALLQPNSPPNYAAFSKLDTVTLTQGQPAMTSTYEDSTIDHFDLKSFYYSCAVASQASIVGIPTSCTVTIKGYKDDLAKELVAEQKFGFATKLLQTTAQMVKADVDWRFKGLKRVEFFVSNDALTAGLVDTVSYTVYSDKYIQ